MFAYKQEDVYYSVSDVVRTHLCVTACFTLRNHASSTSVPENRSLGAYSMYGDAESGIHLKPLRDQFQVRQAETQTLYAWRAVRQWHTCVSLENVWIRRFSWFVLSRTSEAEDKLKFPLDLMKQ